MRRNPYWQFSNLLLLILVTGTLLISITNVLSGESLSDLIDYTLKIMILIEIPIFGFFMMFFYLKFRKLIKNYKKGIPAQLSLNPEEILLFSNLCVQFPFRLFIRFGCFIVGSSLAFHILFWWYYGVTTHNWEFSFTDFFQSFAFEQSLGWTFTLVLYLGTRRILRPVLVWLSVENFTGKGVQISIRTRLLVVVLSLAIMTNMQYQYLQSTLSNQTQLFETMFASFGLFLFMTYFFTRSVTDDMIKDLNQVRASLAEFNSLDFPNSFGRLPVVSWDEIGDLKVQFNLLQDKAERYYTQLSKEWELASRVQLSLLPSSPLHCGRFTVMGQTRSAESLGGDFYDYQLLNDRNVVTLIGDVSGKGLPAALVAATVIGLFRSEIQHEGSASELMRRMSRSIHSLLLPDMFVTIALLCVDIDTGAYQYASAGHLPPLQIQTGQIIEWDTSSLPMGYGPEEPFAEKTGVFLPGDRFISYTDGFLETKINTGHMLGFEQFQSWIQALLHKDHIDHTLMDQLAATLDTHRLFTKREDDETLLLLHFN